MARKNTAQIVVIALVVIFLFLLFSVSGIARIITDYFWFQALDFIKIFMVSLQSKIALFFLSAAIFFAFVMLNLWLSGKIIGARKGALSIKAKLVISLVLSFFVGLATSAKWLTAMEFLKQVPFGIKDPVLSQDISFYVFSLPFYQMVLGFAMTALVIAFIITLIDYLKPLLAGLGQSMQYTPQGEMPSFDFKKVWSQLGKKPKKHLAALLALFFILIGIRHYLARYSIMYSEEGIVVGAGYADIVAYLPMVKILMIAAFLVAALFLAWIFYHSKQGSGRWLTYAFIGYLVLALVGPTVVPAVVQSYRVAPNELNLEKPYIRNNINFTRKAYGLSEVEVKPFPVEKNLTPAVLEKASATLNNVRILDWRPLTQTYKQTQEIRLYYDLSGIDLDRYHIQGNYTEVMLAPRELEQNQLAEEAKTWVNLHQIYTHGYGTVMSPVDQVTKEGLPRYYIQDIPPAYTIEEPDIKIDQPRIYYGEKHNPYAIVNTQTKEFDYPQEGENKFTQYQGQGGVELDSFLKKLLMALRFGDIKILLSSDVTPDSRIMFQRHIQDRISRITPFLKLDRDPYLVISDGRLYWIQDAYTVSHRYPYSKKKQGINYIRNSVKVVVDAYDGTVNYYIMDKSDPLIMTYARIFPKQFNLFKDMPEGLKQHIRYPEDLFRLQSSIYTTYHMQDVGNFYNKEDAWEIPQETYGVGQQVKVEPYYIILQLPGEPEAEFVMMTTFTPIRKDNMISWMAARCDAEDYGKLLLYQFPKDKLVFGPSQIEAKFDQEGNISEQLTLWSQRGSRVTRGNLLVIPINHSVLYIEPLYLQAEKGQLPELKRVLVSDGKRVVMEKNLDLALERLFGKLAEEPEKLPEEGPAKSREELIEEASKHYQAVLDSMSQGNWSGIGKNLNQLGQVLGNLSR